MKYHVSFDLELKKNPFSGLYIALEGIDGSGKTTQVGRLKSYFEDKGKEVVVTREPRKSGLLGDVVHKVLLGEEKLPSAALQYLFTAERVAHHEELIEPALNDGKVVISDRCFWSAIVYGILDRTGGKYDINEADTILATQGILSMYHQFIVPDYTFYIQISIEESIRRIKGKKVKEIYEDEEKIKRVFEGYKYLKNRFADEIILVNGEQAIDNVTDNITEILAKKSL